MHYHHIQQGVISKHHVVPVIKRLQLFVNKQLADCYIDIRLLIGIGNSHASCILPVQLTSLVENKVGFAQNYFERN